jgi:E3 ubiquitin-protein ligase RAD18
LAARPQALKIAREERDEANKDKKPAKRKRAVQDSDDIAEAEGGGRTTRSKSRRTVASQSSQQELIEVDDSDEDGSFEPEKPKDDGLIECPLGCGKRMKIEAVEPHLDRCEDEKEAERKAKSRTPTVGVHSSRASQRNTPRPQDRISELNYSLLKETAMRKKMDELGLPSFGGKQLMVRRHTEWVNLWNANCDSSNSRTKRELLHDLDTWERTQGGRAPTTNQGYGIMRKDFDGNSWANKNKVDFKRLIADARRKKTTTPPNPEPDQQGRKPAPTSDREEGEEPDHSKGSAAPAPDQEAAQVQPKVNQERPPYINGLSPQPLESSRHFTNNTEPNPVQQERTPPANDYENLVPSESIGLTREESHDYHVNHNEGTAPCELPSHVATSSVRKVPMFSLPQESSTDS